jgi:hypothetical protein
LYRFLENERVNAEAILRAIYKEGTKDLEEGERLVCVDISLIKKPYSKALEGLHFVGPEKVPGYELITCLGLDKEGNISLGYAHLVSHREKCFKSMPDEVRRGIEEAAVNLKRGNSCLIYVCDRGFDDRKVFEKVTELDESFVIRAYKDRKFDGGRKLKEVSEEHCSSRTIYSENEGKGQLLRCFDLLRLHSRKHRRNKANPRSFPRSCPKKPRQVAFAYQPTRKLA